MALPHHLKTDGRAGKLVLRALARRWLPAEIAAHKKHGFTIPLDVMVPAEVHTLLSDVLLGPGARTRHWINQDLVRGWLTKFRQAGPGSGESVRRDGTISRAGLYQRVFMLLSQELWMRDHALSW